MATHRRRSVRRSNGPSIRRTTNQYWVDGAATGGLTVTGGIPQIIRLDVNLATDYDATTKGATVLSVRGSITAFATTTAAAANCVLTAGILVDSNTTPVADLDPTTVRGRQRDWMWQTDWPWPLTTPAAIAGQFMDARREIKVASRRIYNNNDDSLFLVLGSQPTVSVQTWQVFVHTRALIRVP